MLDWQNPEALWLLLGLVLWIVLKPRLWNLLRCAIALGMILALTELQWTRDSGEPRVIAVLDLSSSCKDRVLETWKETKGILEKSKPSEAILESFAFAGEARAWPCDEQIDLKPMFSRLRQGLLTASASIPIDERANILLISDGRSTEPLDGLADYLTRRGHALYWYKIHQEWDGDAAVTMLTIPEQSAPQEAFLVDIEVRGPGESLEVNVKRDQQSLGIHKIPLVEGRGRLRLKDHIDQPGHFRYIASIHGHNDAQRGNDSMSQSIRVEGRGGVLLVSPYRPDPLAESWRRSGTKVIHVPEPENLTVGMLSGVQAVVFNDTPADKIPMEFLKALIPYVELQGGGFAMVGGKHSFGAGGYYRSPIDPLLPVSLELKEERYKLSLALGIVLDRSGSMGVTVGGGKTKMRLANEGSASAVELLGPSDAVAVFAVDSTAHPVVPLSKVGNDQASLGSRIRQIQSMGGGIFVYEGLAACWNELRGAPQSNRHIILFSDAADSEEPGDYKKLLSDMALENATVSVIGLGRRSDPDAALLTDIAKLGSGRMFFCENANDLPGIFAQETMSVSRSAYIEETRMLEPLQGLFNLGVQVPTPKMVQAYNLCAQRNSAYLGLVTADEDQDPLLAFWQRGAGKVLCYMAPLSGVSAQNMLAWGPYDDFCGSWVRWIMKGEWPLGVGLERRRVGDSMQFDLYYDSSWDHNIAQSAPLFSLVELQNPESIQNLVWDQTQPGHFRVTVPLSMEQEWLGAIAMGNSQLAVGPLTLGYSSEWVEHPEILHELREISRISGGGSTPRLDHLWNQDQLKSTVPLWPWIATWLGVLILLEMLAFKMAWNVLWFGVESKVFKVQVQRGSTLQESENIGKVKEVDSKTSMESDPFEDRLKRIRKG